MGELIAGVFELILELLLVSRKTAPYVLGLIVLLLVGFGVYYFIGV